MCIVYAGITCHISLYSNISVDSLISEYNSSKFEA